MLGDAEFRRLLHHFNRSWKGYRRVRKGVKKRIRRHMQALGCTNVRDYLARVDRDPEQEAVTQVCLLVTISRFFRDRQLWETLSENVLPGLAGQFPGTIRAWSAGCACGEEALSLSILWHRIKARGMDAHLDILATDANPKVLERAKQGRFTKSSLREVDACIRQKWFKKIPGHSQYKVDPIAFVPIFWQVHDHMNPLPGKRFHIILLRNSVLTYCRGDEQKEAFSRILDCLIPGGYLVIGAHEVPPPAFEGVLEPNFDCPFVYRRLIE